MADTFLQAMRLMHKHDPQLREDGFAMLEPIAADVLPQLIAAFEEEPDHGLRCWLLELIGDARSRIALPVFNKELTSNDESIRHWARRGLEQLDTKDARTILWRDSQNEARMGFDTVASATLGFATSGMCGALSEKHRTAC